MLRVLKQKITKFKDQYDDKDKKNRMYPCTSYMLPYVIRLQQIYREKLKRIEQRDNIDRHKEKDAFRQIMRVGTMTHSKRRKSMFFNDKTPFQADEQ